METPKVSTGMSLQETKFMYGHNVRISPRYRPRTRGLHVDTLALLMMRDDTENWSIPGLLSLQHILFLLPRTGANDAWRSENWVPGQNRRETVSYHSAKSSEKYSLGQAILGVLTTLPNSLAGGRRSIIRYPSYPLPSRE